MPMAKSKHGDAKLPRLLSRVGLAALLLAGVIVPTARGASENDHQILSLELRKAQMLPLPMPITDIVVGDPELVTVIVKTPQRVALVGRAVGDTNAVFLDQNGNAVLNLEIRVERDLRGIEAALAQIVPNADIALRALNGDILVTGEVPSAATAEEVLQVIRRFVEEDTSIINQLKFTGQQQVILRIKVAEMQRDLAKRIGVNLFLDKKRGLTLRSPPAFNLFTEDGNQIDSSIVGTLDDEIGRLEFGPTLLDERFEGAIEYLEEQGLTTILAEPNLTAVSGEPADFLVGGEFPVPVGYDADTNSIQIEFKQFGVGLTFTPVVLDGGLISLKISTEVSELTETGSVTLSGLEIPGLTVRRASSTVEMASGASIVLAGLLQETTAKAVAGFPGLMNLPILGALFRRTELERESIELVVIATPYLVNPTTPDQLTLPTDGFAPGSDIDYFLLGGLYERYGKPKTQLGAVFERPFGYLLR